jgi:cell division protein ZapB
MQIKERWIMSFEVLEQLEAKVQSAVDGISLLKMELDELRAQNQQLKEENQQLKNDHLAWQERLRALLGKMDQMEHDE